MGSVFGKNKQPETKISNINAGGIRTSGKSTIRATSSSERQGLVGNISRTFGQQADFLGSLRPLVAPGFSALRESRLEGLAGNRRRTLGDLRENLARRRVLGSSFAQDALSRANLEFQREEDRVRSESFLQELELSTALAQETFEARRAEFGTFLDELNLQAQVATQIASQATTEMNANARMKAELDAQSAGGFGRLLGTAAGFALAPATGGASILGAETLF